MRLLVVPKGARLFAGALQLLHKYIAAIDLESPDWDTSKDVRARGYHRLGTHVRISARPPTGGSP